MTQGPHHGTRIYGRIVQILTPKLSGSVATCHPKELNHTVSLSCYLEIHPMWVCPKSWDAGYWDATEIFL